MKHFKPANLLVPFLSGLALMVAPIVSAHAQPANIALGKPVIFGAAPNYALCTDPADITQLTDGAYSTEGRQDEVEGSKSIWVQKGTVGWQNVKPTIITIDLGSVQPISGVSFSTGAGTAGVSWPTAIYVLVSDDNRNWRAVGDLAILSRHNGRPPAEGYAAFRYVTHDLRTKGRYIAFAVVATPFAFADEIEVYKGDGDWLGQPSQGEVVADIKEYANASLVTSAAQRRLYDDLDFVQAELAQAKLSVARESTLKARLQEAQAKVAQMPRLGRDFKTILPLNDVHREVLAVRGELLAAQGSAPLTVWKTHRYSRLPFLAVPNTKAKAQLGFSMLRDQFRSDVLLLTNAGGAAQRVALQFKNVPANAQSGWLTVSSVAWTDNADGTPTAAALIPLESQNGIYTVDVPAGLTRKVWFTVNSSKLAPGRSGSTLEVSSGSAKIQVPATFDISPVAMQQPRLSLTMWDYTNGKGLYGITLQNRQAAIALMRSHYVDTPWASGIALPRPEASAFDAQNNLKTKLDFSNLDEWIALWPGAKRYLVFANVPDSFAGAKMNTPEFSARVASWAKALSQHMQDLGLQPQQLGILLVDEPYREAQDATISAWAKVINAAAPKLTLFSDPRWKQPHQTKDQYAITAMDILCPALPTYNSGGKAVQDYYQKLRAEGRALWFYQTSGPSWALDPQLYYRYQAWHAFSANATGEGFWSFGDIGKAPTSWNGYSNTGVTYAPVFFDENAVYSGIQWDAVREGVQDYEELAMLRDAIAASKNATWKAHAQRILDDAVESVTRIWAPGNYSKGAKNPHLADTQLQKVRAALNGSTP